MKTCRKCGKRKRLEAFPPCAARKDGRHSYCRPCRQEYDREWHAKTYQRRAESVRKRQRDRRARLVEKLLIYLAEHPCVDCGEADPVVLQFDHRDDETKVGNVSDFLRNKRLWESVLTEIAKCDVRCANCHVRRTQQFGWRKHA